MTPITTEYFAGGWIATRGDWDLGDPIGHGTTEAEAIENLLIVEDCQ
jgi:hypothetical protein